MIWGAVVVALITLGVGLILALGLRALPTVRLQLTGLAALAVCLPLSVVLLSGWVMFHMGDDVKILAMIAASATVAMIGGLFLARSIAGSIDNVRDAAVALSHGDLTVRAPESGPAEVADLAESFNEMAANLEQLFDARRELVAWASHDLRTPLANMQAMLEALEDGLAEPEDYLPALGDQVRGLTLLVDDLFELARIDAGALTLELHASALDDVVSVCLRGVSAEAAQRHISLDADVSPTAVARFAPDKVERVLLNLLTNALRHTPSDGAVAVRVEPDCRQRPRHGGGHGRGARRGGGAAYVRPLLAQRPGPLTARRRPRSRDRPRPHRGAGRPHLGGEPPGRRCAGELHAAGCIDCARLTGGGAAVRVTKMTIPAVVRQAALFPEIDLPDPPPEHPYTIVHRDGYDVGFFPGLSFGQVSVRAIAEDALERTIAEARSLLAEHGKSQAAWMVPGATSPAGLADRLRRLGMAPYDEPPLEPRFAAMAVSTPTEPGPAVVEARLARTFEEFQAGNRLAGDAFELSAEDRRAFEAQERLLWDLESGGGAFRTFVALSGGSVVGVQRCHLRRQRRLPLRWLDQSGHARSWYLPSARSRALGRGGRARNARAHRGRGADVATDPRATRLQHRGLDRLPSRPLRLARAAGRPSSAPAVTRTCARAAPRPAPRALRPGP